MTSRAEDGERASWLEVDAAALRANVVELKSLLEAGCRLGVVLKADAYGHGLEQVLDALPDEAEVIYVITAADGLRARALSRSARDVLVIGAVGPREAVALARAGVEAVVGDEGWRGWVGPLREAGARLRVHVHIDSGLGREGWRPDAIGALAELRQASDALEVVGAMMHFADTEDVTHQDYALFQLRGFDEGVRALESALGVSGLTRHAAASAATLVLPESRLDVVRVGIALYGLWPSDKTRISATLHHRVLPELRPVLSWRVVAQHVKELPAGAFVGYGCTHRCRDRTRVAVLPVGYFDGYPRAVSGRAHVLVEGRRCPVLGRVMMNHLIVDVTGVPVEGDRPLLATLIGRDGEEEVTADQLAEWAGTISYEIVARLGGHLPRRRIDAGRGSAC